MEKKLNLNLSKLSLRRKISQMVMVSGNIFDSRYCNLGIGGILMHKLKSKEIYKEIIDKYQNFSKLKLFVAADLEGYWNPFERFYTSKKFGDISNSKEAEKLGRDHRKILTNLGFNMNFSPVVEIRNNVWPGRNFKGNLEEIKTKINGYIRGIQGGGIIATAKHYPGGNLVRDPHKVKYKVKIFKEDLELFETAIKAGVKAIMVGHPIVHGYVNSDENQCTISKGIIFELKKNFDGLIVTDDIGMKGLKRSYFFNFKKVYPDLIKAGNDIILDTHSRVDFKRIYKGIIEIEKRVMRKEISVERINNSVRKILKYKGYNVVD